MTEQGIIVLERRRQPFLDFHVTKVYWNDQNIHQLRGGDQDSFFVEAGKGRLTVKAGLLGKKTAKLQVSPTQRQHVFISLNISTIEVILRILSVLFAVAWLLAAVVLNVSDVRVSALVLGVVLVLNILLQINRLQIRTRSNAKNSKNQTAV